MQQLEKCSDADLSEDFVEAVNQFIAYVYDECPTKKLETGQEINGRSRYRPFEVNLFPCFSRFSLSRN